jgi:hypothetical protein
MNPLFLFFPPQTQTPLSYVHGPAALLCAGGRVEGTNRRGTLPNLWRYHLLAFDVLEVRRVGARRRRAEVHRRRRRARALHALGASGRRPRCALHGRTRPSRRHTGSALRIRAPTPYVAM